MQRNNCPVTHLSSYVILCQHKWVKCCILTKLAWLEYISVSFKWIHFSFLLQWINDVLEIWIYRSLSFLRVCSPAIKSYMYLILSLMCLCRNHNHHNNNHQTYLSAVLFLYGTPLPVDLSTCYMSAESQKEWTLPGYKEHRGERMSCGEHTPSGSWLTKSWSEGIQS